LKKKENEEIKNKEERSPRHNDNEELKHHNFGKKDSESSNDDSSTHRNLDEVTPLSFYHGETPQAQDSDSGRELRFKFNIYCLLNS
jgi:hypothetical protein